MHEHGLAKELWPQLKQIAQDNGFSKVSNVEMIVGVLHGVSGDFLAHSFAHAFENTNFEGATVQIKIVEPSEQFVSSGQDKPASANGWELLVTKMEGEM